MSLLADSSLHPRLLTMQTFGLKELQRGWKHVPDGSREEEPEEHRWLAQAWGSWAGAGLRRVVVVGAVAVVMADRRESRLCGVRGGGRGRRRTA